MGTRAGADVSTLEWFLSASERGNKASNLPLWCEGNLAVSARPGVGGYGDNRRG